MHHFSSLARRLGRIFAHAFFHHREVFEAAEAENALYARFLALTTRFDLVPPEFLVHPPRLASSSSSSFAGAANREEGERALAEKEDEIEPPRLLAASLNPNLTHQQQRSRSPEKPTPVVLESPRKLGRNRTDTMIFSDEFGEQLREQMGSPLSLNLSGDRDDGDDGDDVDNEGRAREEKGAFGIPHMDELKVLASSEEQCPSKSQKRRRHQRRIRWRSRRRGASGTRCRQV